MNVCMYVCVCLCVLVYVRVCVYVGSSAISSLVEIRGDRLFSFVLEARTLSDLHSLSSENLRVQSYMMKSLTNTVLRKQVT